MPSLPRSPTKPSLLVAAFAAVALVAAPAARAEDVGFQLNRYEPTPAGDFTFAVEHPWYSSTRWFAAGLTLDYAHDPLVVRVRDAKGGDLQQISVVEHQLLGHLDLAGSFLDRIAITATLPITLYEGGTRSSSADIAPLAGAAVGDPRLGVRARILGQPDTDAFSLHAAASVWIPVDTANDHAGDHGVRVLPRVVVAGMARSIRWSASAGFLVRGDAVFSSAASLNGAGARGNPGHVGHEIQLGAAAAWTDESRRFHVGPELTFATRVSDVFTHDGSSLEALVGVSYLAFGQLLVGAAGGLGFLGEPGTPGGRVLLRVAWAPEAAPRASQPEPPPPPPARPAPPPPPAPSDRDRDGIPDGEDGCPDVKGERNAEPAQNGCPPVVKDSDGDGIPDDRDRCPNEPARTLSDPARPGCPARDRDGDGVPDTADACPELAAGAHADPRRKGCPAGDPDGDGVTDDEDRCPSVHAGLAPDTVRRGCPAPDADHDTVPDAVDACPYRAGAPDPDPRRNGCPGLVEVRNGIIVILSPVFFATGKDLILRKSFPVLDAVANAMKLQPAIKLVAIEGHTDNLGGFEHNMDLSNRRAASVVKHLVRAGVDEGRLTSQGFGPSRPIATNSTEEGRAQNRRVEFRIIDPAPQNEK